jgi:hypothetical protein
MGQVSMAVQGALRLARLDPRGMAFFDRSVAGFWQSYRAAAICYPVYMAMLLLLVPSGDTAGPAAATPVPAPDWFRILLVESIGYVIQWVGFALLMLPVSRFLGREERWLDYIVAYNWSQILQMAVQLAALLLIASGLAPASPVILLQDVVLLLYGGFIAHIALGIGGTAATMVVLLDFTFGTFIALITQALH